jgi:putative flippase GtrA
MMTKIRHLVAAQLAARKELRYLLAGIASEVIEYLSFFALLALTNLLVVSNSISFILGIASGFVFHKLWSFAGQHQFKTRHQLAAYCALATFNFTATNVLISLFVHQLQLHAAVAKLAVMAITAAWSYLVFNKLIFRRQP